MILRHAILLTLVVITSTLASAQTVEEALKSKLDLWGEAALKQPDGPTYEFFQNKLPPFRYVEAPFRQRCEHHRPNASAQSASLPSRRCDGAGICLAQPR